MSINTIKRAFSILVRSIKKPFTVKKIINELYYWRNRQSSLPLYQPVLNKLLIIRLDDIGDYIVWRNSLHFYKQSAKWKHHHITLLGNKIWKTIFDYADSAAVDQTIWVEKSKYLTNDTYRFEIWEQLRGQGFETVICPSKTRTLLLDDLCTLATGSPNTIAAESTFAETEINVASDQLYKHIYHHNKVYHEFFFNQDFANWCCHTSYYIKQPCIDTDSLQPIEKDYILCYIGASSKGKRLPVKTWVKLIVLLQQSCKKRIVVAGGPAEKAMSEQIIAATKAHNITGTVSLSDMICYTASAAVVITGDTMEAHLASSCKTPAVIVSNGNNFARFAAYKQAGISNIETVYAKPFLKTWKKKNYALFSNYVAVSDDITTVSAQDIFQAFQKVYHT